MKIQVLQENFIKALNIASRLISTKAQLPILANILLATEENRLKIASTNLEMGVTIWIGAKIEKEGAITLPSRILQEYVSSLPADKINFEVKNNIANLNCGSFNASFNGIAASEFPALPKKEKKVFVFSGPVLSQIIFQVAFAAAADEGRPILTGVFVKAEGKLLTFAATDGYRLSVKKAELEKAVVGEFKKEEAKSLMIPARTLSEVAKILSEQEKQEKNLVEVGLTADGNQTIFSFPDIELSTRLLEGEFPDYEKIIPTESTSQITLDREELNKAIKIASIFARDSANIVKLKFTEGKLIISANSPQVGENTSEIEVKIEGEGGEIAFNYRFLLDFLNSSSAGEIVFETTGPLNPGVFKIKDDSSLLHIIMPVRLQS